jgi:hypothetical protein
MLRGVRDSLRRAPPAMTLLASPVALDWLGIGADVAV